MTTTSKPTLVQQPPPARLGFPRYILIAGLALVAFTIIASSISKQTGIGRTAERAVPTSSRMLNFQPREDRTMAVIDAQTGEVLEVLPSAEEGFIAGAVKSLQYERRRHGKPADAPFRLIGEDFNRLALIDPSTGIYLQLEAYGMENARSVARFLPGAPAPNRNTTSN